MLHSVFEISKGSFSLNVIETFFLSLAFLRLLLTARFPIGLGRLESPAYSLEHK